MRVSPTKKVTDPASRPSGGRDSARRAVRLLGELEGDGADEHAGAEGHDETDDPHGDPDEQGDRGTQEERRAPTNPHHAASSTSPR